MTQIYAAHLRHADLFPIWSSTDAFGFGTPILLYYSKLFYYISGPIFILIGNMKASLVLSTGVFMAVGVYGMRRALSLITGRRLLLVVGSVGLIFTNWAFSDWFGRGDLAEFSAMMLVPWLLWWCLNLVTNRRASWSLIPIVVLLVIAHTAIALCSVICVLWAVATFFLGNSDRERKRVAIRRIGISLVGVAVILAPLLAATLRFSSDYDPARKITEYNYLANQNFSNPADLFYFAGFRWLLPLGPRTTTQIDFAIWMPIVLGIVVLVGSTAIWHHRIRLGKYLPLPAVVFLIGSFATYLFLQFRVSSFVYSVIGVLNTIQFPVRMLTLITPIGIVIVTMLANALWLKVDAWMPRRAAWMYGLPLAWLATLIALSPVPARNPQYPYIPPSALIAPNDLSPRNSNIMWAGGEYLPQIGNQLSAKTLAIYEQLLSGRATGAPLTPECVVSEPRSMSFEASQLHMTVRCSRPSFVALPVSLNPDTSIFAVGPHGSLRYLQPVRSPGDPLIVVRIPADKPTRLLVDLPTLWGAL
jgi:hypothetical protein